MNIDEWKPGVAYEFSRRPETADDVLAFVQVMFDAGRIRFYVPGEEAAAMDANPILRRVRATVGG